jgi:hypothetical protein
VWNGISWSALSIANITGTSSSVFSFYQYNNNLIVGGLFSAIGGAPIRNIAQWDGVNWYSFGNMNSAVYSFTTFNNEPFCGGSFSVASGLPADNIAHLINRLIGIRRLNEKIPKNFTLYQNFPNPFNPSTRIKFSVVKSSIVSIEVFDVTGRRISTLVNNRFQPGTYEIDFNAAGLSSGVYFYRLRAGDFIQSKKMVLIK